MKRILRLGAVVAASTGISLACFSERTAGPVVDLEGCDVQLPAEAFGSTIVVIRDFNFTPSAVSVPAGSKVTWVNCEPAGSVAHTSTADAAGWASPLLAPGSTYTRQFDIVGENPYHCEPHPGMRGSVTVE